MIEFTRISIIGFCSIPELELDLNSKGITIIRGYNGQGKSSIFSALVWCLYGKNIKGNSNVNTWKKVQPKKYPGTKVEVYFKTNDSIHRVVRCLRYTDDVDGAKGGSRLIYQVDGSNAEDKKKRGIQSLIEHDLGMSYNLFLNSIMFGQGLKRLIQESGSNQREIFEEVFELGYLTRAQKIAKEKYQASNDEYNLVTKDINYKNQAIEAVNENLESIKSKQSSYEDDQKEIIDGLKARKKEYEAKGKKLTAELEGIKVDKLKNSLRTTNSEIDSAKKELKAAKEALGISLEELVDKIIRLLEKGKYETSLSELNNLKNAFRIQDTNNKKIIKLQKKSGELSGQIHEFETKASTLSHYLDQIGDINRSIKEKKASKPDFQSLIDQNLERSGKLKAEIGDLTKLQLSYKESTDLYKWAYTDPLGNMGIKSYLFSSCLSELNEILETYSETLGFHIKFEVDLESARKDFVTTIQIGSQEVPFEDLSGGQKQLASLAMAFSMNTMIAQAQGVNIAFLDEVFESLSSDKIEIVTELIKKIYRDKTLFLITHQESIPIPNARVLRVTQENGLSKYEL